ncbi:MAG TPA: COX15/CtaA family protein [Vicinamibacterales bacterium]|nr:COX15/CtaA family protein [Vicinamibacterales bacterium]
MPRPARFAWLVLGYTVTVILWGAYVRATGSGAGCGNHWPLCNGEVVPRAPGVATLIEYSHRLSSGAALLAVVALLVWIRRTCPPGHPARLGSVLSVVFMITEAAVGAGLVLFELVADDASAARAMFMSTHLLNTFMLLGSIALTAWWLTADTEVRLAGNTPTLAGLGAGCAALLVVGSSGAIAALGDTLFPAESLVDALRADLSATSHLLVRLRVLHPFLAVLTALALMAGAPRLARDRGPFAVRFARIVGALLAVQIALGFLNAMLLAPVWLQLAHLLVADAVWIAFVLLGAAALGEGRHSTAAGRWRVEGEPVDGRARLPSA